MDTSLLDTAISTAVSTATEDPQFVAVSAIPGWPDGTIATVMTDTYSTLEGDQTVTGFRVTGIIRWPFGFSAMKIVDVGPNRNQSQDWSPSLDSDAAQFLADKVQIALSFAYDANQLFALYLKLSAATAAGQQSNYPKLVETEQWVQAVQVAVASGSDAPAFPGYSFSELMSEIPHT